MSPTLAHGQSVFVVRPTFSWNQLRRGDVVVFRRPGRPDDTYIKRIIGLRDEEITLAGRNFYADDVLVVTPQEVPGDHKKTWWNGPDEFFVLGDNPTLSTDSRTFGPRPGRSNNRPRLATLLAPKGMGVGTMTARGFLVMGYTYSIAGFPEPCLLRTIFPPAGLTENFVTS